MFTFPNFQTTLKQAPRLRSNRFQTDLKRPFKPCQNLHSTKADKVDSRLYSLLFPVPLPESQTMVKPTSLKGCSLLGAVYMSVHDLSTPAPAPCPRCRNASAVHYFGSEWCDDCLHECGFIPRLHSLDSVRVPFRLIYDHLSARGEWARLSELALLWTQHEADVLAGRVVAKLLPHVPRDSVGCKICGTALDDGAIAGCCSRPCYNRWYYQEQKKARD